MKASPPANDQARLDNALHQARQLIAAGQPAAADKLYRQITTAATNYAQAWHDWGQLGLHLRQPRAALPMLSRAVELAPNNPAFQFALGQTLLQLGQLPAAEQALCHVTRLAPDNPAGHHELGILYKHLGQHDRASACLQQAIRLAPADHNARFNLGLNYFVAGKTDLAIDSYRQALSLKDDDAGIHSALGVALHAGGHFGQAVEHLQRATRLEPNNPDWHRNLSEALREQGRLDEAIDSYRRGLAKAPDHAALWHGLAMTRRYRDPADPEIGAMKALFDKQRLPDEEQTKLAFALGKVLDDCDQAAQAWPYFQTANARRRTAQDFCIDRESEYFQAIKTHFDRDYFARQTAARPLPDKGRPIFIIGMPRSGTSLVEQILASHSQIHGCGEIADLALAVQKVIGKETARETLPQRCSRLNDTELTAIAGDYLRRTASISHGERWLSNKLPFNFLHVGLIHTLFPSALVFHCRRHPLATCLSIYQHDFTRMDGFAYDIDELARYYRLYHDLMQHWQTVLPGFVIEIDYEALVADQAAQSRQLIGACDLPWEAACLDFHQNRRAVSTASFTQVRQPLYRHALARWQKYAQPLEPLRSALADLLPEARS